MPGHGVPVSARSARQDEAHGLGPGRGVAQLAAHRGGHRRAPGLRTPRIDMHRCSHSTTTMTPRGSRMRTSASAICVVSRSCTCGRLAKTSTRRASLDSPVIRPSRARDVADVRDAVEGHQVVLAGGVHLDVPTSTISSWPRSKVVVRTSSRLLAQPGEQLGVRPRDPRRGVAQAVARRVLADGGEQLAHGGLGPLGRSRAQPSRGPGDADPRELAASSLGCPAVVGEAVGVAADGSGAVGRLSRTWRAVGATRWPPRLTAPGGHDRRAVRAARRGRGPVHAGRAGRSPQRLEDPATCSLSSVSFSSSSSTRSSSTSRFSRGSRTPRRARSR